LQSSPLRAATAVRAGDRAYYWWLWPNLMLNVYDGVMDTNLVVPTGPETCRVIIDFWFADAVSAEARAESIAVAHRIQEEDIAVSEEVQRGLQSASYAHGRFSAKREAAGYHFHKLLAAALRTK
jgi:choline monooxygenase